MLRDTFVTKINSTDPTLEDELADEALELPVDLIRSGDNLIIRAPMVGVDISAVSVTISDNQLTIRKSASPDLLDEVDRSYLQECHWGELVRAIDLPLAVNPDRTRATLHDGVLTVVMPIVNQHESKLIRVKDKS